MAGRKKTKAGETPLLDHAAHAANPPASAEGSTDAAATPVAARVRGRATHAESKPKAPKAPKGLPSFSQQTVLFHWLLGQLDVPSLPASASAEKRWDALKGALEAVEAEAWITAPTPMGQALVTALGLELGAGAGKKVGADDVLRWDARVFAITDRLNHAGRPEPIQWKYFQYLALVFTELYLERYFTDAEALRADLDAFLAGFTPGGVNLGLSPYRVDPETEIDDLAKLAFWMATGSGKTWLLHANLLQYLTALERHGRSKPNGILLVSPNAGLSAQHKAELDLAGIPARLFKKGDSANSAIVQIIEITKFSKKPGPDTVAVERFEGPNLVFIDEGHRGSSSVDGEWRAIRQALAKQGFCFEYSATFAQAAAKNEEIRREYAKSILVDYAYRKFHGDGYGKHFRIMNIRGSASAKARELEGHHRRAYLTGALVVLAQQLMTWDEDRALADKHGLDRPFCVFVGASVTGGEGEAAKSDVVLVLDLIARFVRERDATEVILDDLLNGRSGFATRRGQDVFDVSSVLPELHRRGHGKASLYEDMLKRVFNAGPQGGLLHLQQLADGEGEIGLYIGDPTKTPPFGVINVGEPQKLLKLVEQTLDPRLVHVEEKAFKGSLFATINTPGSTLTMLIGSKKFTEGWSSWRVSLMGLLNIGKSAGTQIVQLFGRGVRLRGQNRSLKRATQAGDKLAAPGTTASKLRVLETLNIFGVRADYMELFEDELRQDGIEEEPEPHVEVLRVVELAPMPELRVLRLPDEREWKRSERPAFSPEVIGAGVGRVVIDAYARVDIKSRGPAGVQAAALNVERGPLPCFVFVDHDRLYRDLIEHKTRQGWSNLGLPREVDWGGARVPLTRALLSGSWYELKIPNREVEPGRLQNLGLWQQLASELVLKYLARFRSTMLGRYQAARAEIVWLSELAEDKRQALFPSQYTITVTPDQGLEDTVKQLVLGVKTLLDDKVRDFHRPAPNLIEALGWGRHLYQPLIYIPRSGKQSMSLQSKPVALNEGEWLLVTHLKALVGRASYLDGVDVWLLRNPSRNGLGFRDVRGAFPDFILWLVRGDEQWFSFIDPHGIRMVTDPASEPKLHLWKTLREIEGRHPDMGVHLDAWVLSVTPEHEAAPGLRPFADHHIVYQDNEGRYLEVVMKRLLGVDARSGARSGYVEEAPEGVEPVITKPQATLRSIELVQWKSFERATLPLGPLTVLIGANASGKSNVIEALNLLRWIASGARLSGYLAATRGGEIGMRGALEDLVRRDAPEPAMSFGCELDGLGGELDRLHLDLTLAVNDGELRVEREELSMNGKAVALYRAMREPDAVGNVLQVSYHAFGEEGRAELSAVDHQAVFAQVMSPARFSRDHKRSQEVVPRAATSVAEALGRIHALDPNPSLMRGYWRESDKELQHDGANLSATLFWLCQDESMRARILGFVGELPEKPVDGIEFIRVPRGDVMVQVRETFGGVKRLVDAPILSDGTLRVLAVAAALLSVPRGTLLVIEEFDNGIHPSQAGRLVRRVEETAKERGLRVLLTTHNPAMLDALPPATLADVVACHRDPERGDSRLTRLSDLDIYATLLAKGPLGQSMSRGVLARFLRERDDADERTRKALRWLDSLQAAEEGRE